MSDRTERCLADGGTGLGAGHHCKCVGKKNHEPYYGVGHGCGCGALWKEPSLPEQELADDYERNDHR